MNLELKDSMSHWMVSLLRQLCYIWWPMMSCSKNSSRLRFVHRMCSVTSFYRDKILILLGTPRQVRDLQRTLTMKCILLHRNVTYSSSNKCCTDHQGMGWWKKQWLPVHGLNPVGQLKWTTLTCTNPSMFFLLFSLVTTNTTKFKRLF